jgi:hypothetical protein
MHAVRAGHVYFLDLYQLLKGEILPLYKSEIKFVELLGFAIVTSREMTFGSHL